jgi:hypothetical protein
MSRAVITTPRYFYTFSDEAQAAMRSALREHAQEYRDFNGDDSSANVILESIWNAAVDHR